ncbi:hypothetical protein LSH36_22g03035 [Paralvinella palmiformis]|uniref:Homeobox domain-containing protein n=1 Tax=Paralvinella palmiformis TaxID=53620 RepID=A0AAD9KB47_9ANNE|nr:hypothetical protein LSH36_22g03035 [Paralvinella palmiformis]
MSPDSPCSGSDTEKTPEPECSRDHVADSLSKKPRRRRTAFTHAQLQYLERKFRCQKYLSVADRADVADKLNLSETQLLLGHRFYDIREDNTAMAVELIPPRILKLQSVQLQMQALQQLGAGGSSLTSSTEKTAKSEKKTPLVYDGAVMCTTLSGSERLIDSCAETKWKRQTTAAMRADQLRNHVCDEKDCPGARRLSIETNFCQRCQVAPSSESTASTDLASSALLSRLYFSALAYPLTPACRI